MEENIQKKTTAGLVAEAGVVYRGVMEAARRVGCSREHLSRVLHGKQRAGRRLARTLSKMGITTTVAGEKL